MGCMTLAADVIAYLASLTLTGGDHDGSAFTPLAWERRFVRGAFSVEGDAALSVARGNGKSALVAGIGAAVVDPLGPLTANRAEVVCVASAFAQSRVIYEDCIGFLTSRGHNLDDRRVWRKQDSANLAALEYRPTGARIRCIGSDPARAHGMRPRLVLADEPTKFPDGTADRMLSALRTSLGKISGSKLIALGTRDGAPDHWFLRLLASAPYAQLHAARRGDPPFRVRTWRKANPSLDALPSLRAQLEREAADARRDPVALQSFLALRLNSGDRDTLESTLVEAHEWQAAEALPSERAGPVIWGLDLGSSHAMSAAAAFWPLTGRIESLAAFPREPDLGERGLAAGVGGLYRDMATRGELLQLGDGAVDLRSFVAECLDRFGEPSAVTGDFHRAAELQAVLDSAGVPVAAWEPRQQGFISAGADVRDFRRALADGDVRPLPSLLLRAALSEARLIYDAAGNAKIARRTQGGRRARAHDDAAVAAVLAVAVGSRGPVPLPSQQRAA